MRSVTGNCGMTLVEVLVAGIVSVIVAGVFLVIYSMYNFQVNESSSYLAMQRQYETLSEQIAFHTRVAHNIIDESFTWTDTCDTLYDTTKMIKFYSDSGGAFAGIGIRGDAVVEYVADNDSWIDFDAGNGVIHVNPDSSWFRISGCRNAIALHLMLKYENPDTTFYLEPRMDEFLCRN